MYLKEGVEIAIMTPELLEGILCAHACFIDAGQQFTITSLTDGAHSINSFHYLGLAVDIRTRTLKGITPLKMAELLRARLGRDWDVVVESTHLHLEHDPK